jgi:hypothetical protein
VLEIKPFTTLLVLSNIVAEAFTYLFGLFIGVIGTTMAHVKGIDNLTSEKADSIMRHLKKGSVGFLVLTLGYFGANSVYGVIWGAGYVALVMWSINKAKKS